MLVTRGLGGLVPGLVTAGLEGITTVVIVSVPVPTGKLTKQKQLLTINREDEEIEQILMKVVQWLT
jgi:hypothetical protein